MEVRFTPEEEARLARIATQEGMDPEELVKDAALRLLEDDARFRAGVRKGVEQADRGELIEEEEMDGRVKRMFRPSCGCAGRTRRRRTWRTLRIISPSIIHLSQSPPYSSFTKPFAP